MKLKMRRKLHTIGEEDKKNKLLFFKCNQGHLILLEEKLNLRAIINKMDKINAITPHQGKVAVL